MSPDKAESTVKFLFFFVNSPFKVEYTVRRGYTGEEDDDLVEHVDQEDQEGDLQVNHLG